MGKAGWKQRERYDGTIKTKGRKLDYFVMLDIHPKIKKVSKGLFDDEHYAQAIFEAYKVVNNFVKEKSGCSNLDGKALMFKAFDEQNPILVLNGNSTTSEKDEQEGFKHLFAGAMQGIRNPKAHDYISQKDPYVTLQYLALASLLCRAIDNSRKV